VGRRLRRGQEKRKAENQEAAERSNARCPSNRITAGHRGLQSSTEKMNPGAQTGVSVPQEAGPGKLAGTCYNAGLAEGQDGKA